MPTERIIFLREDPYTRFDHNRFGIDTLEKRGFSVEFWDCSKIFRPQFQGAQRASDINGFSGLRFFMNKRSLLDNIAGLTSRDTLMTTMGFSVSTWSVLRQIAKSKASWGTLRLGALPIPPTESHFRSRLEKFIRRPSTAVNFILQKLPPEIFGLRPYDLVLIGGKAPWLGAPARLKGANTKILDVPSFDYGLHLRAMNEKEEADHSQNVVFLDDGGPLHRDQFIFNTPFPCTQEEYFYNLNSFFRLVEKKFGYSVVVASHPRVDYEKMGNPFEGRKIVQGETPKWVKNSNFVLSYCSTAVSFAVINKKPVVFLALNPNKRNAFDPLTQSVASKIGKTPIYWNGKGDINWDHELAVNQDYYDQYMDTYIKKCGSPEKLCWEILADHLTSRSG